MKFKIGDKVKYKGIAYEGLKEGKILEVRNSNKLHPYKVEFYIFPDVLCSEKELELIEEDPICFPVDPPIYNAVNTYNWEKGMDEAAKTAPTNFLQVMGPPEVTLEHIQNMLLCLKPQFMPKRQWDEWLKAALETLDGAIEIESRI